MAPNHSLAAPAQPVLYLCALLQKHCKVCSKGSVPVVRAVLHVLAFAGLPTGQIGLVLVQGWRKDGEREWNWVGKGSRQGGLILGGV